MLKHYKTGVKIFKFPYFSPVQTLAGRSVLQACRIIALQHYIATRQFTPNTEPVYAVSIQRFQMFYHVFRSFF